MQPTSARVGLLVWAAAFLVAFFALGWYVTRIGEPAPLLAVERAILNHSTLLAWWLTWGCYWEVLVPAGIALIVVAWRFPQWRARIVWSLVTLLLCWAMADLAQHIFGRPRRLDWVVKHETSFSYPSSHASLSP
ncbi:MAG TPA: hypothetical protein VMS32_03540, partial [Verrucomicrobiae bacterium]|nr:hypothetical protein [Verrucomicrobiae bacterium]